MRAADWGRPSRIAAVVAIVAAVGVFTVVGFVASLGGEEGKRPVARSTSWESGDTWQVDPSPGDAAGEYESTPPATGPSQRQLPRKSPLVVAHRGASAYRPENTIASFRLAIAMGADFIEGDLVVTRDGSLVVRHDVELSTTTDVASRPEFSQRRTTKRLDGSTVTGWFVEDFTLAELKTLRATTRQVAGAAKGPALNPPQGRELPAQPPAEETVPTITEVINLARAAGAERGRAVGLYFELKSPSYFRSVGLAPEPLLAAALQAGRLTTKDAQVFVESFESESLRLLRQSVSVPLIQLLWGTGQPNDPDTKPEALHATAQYAAGIGLPRARLRVPGIPEAAANGVNRNLVNAVHQAGLELHVYTFEDKGTRAETLSSYQAYYTARVDAIFTDKPDLAISMRN